jgi:hypothetical protein
MLAHWAAPADFDASRLVLFFHWVRTSEEKTRRLSALARKRPGFRVVGPTPLIVEQLRQVGFSRAALVPYPIPPVETPAAPVPFRHLLYGGAARLDKGFDRVVDLVEHLHRSRSSLPVVVQTSSRHYGKTDPRIVAHLERLESVGYPNLQTWPQTLDGAAYGKQFEGAVCLQLYDRAEFADRVSVVTFDALSRGAPVVAFAGTWLGRLIERFGAGAALNDASPAALGEAVERIAADYARYSAAALEGGRVLQREFHASRLLDAVLA